MTSRRRTGGDRPQCDPERGQASAELVAVIPLLVVAVLALGQVVVAGYALWSAGTAARAGARAEHVGGDARAAARSALPSPLRSRAKIETGGPIEVEVGTPALLPGVPTLEVRASADLDPAGGDG
jgi:hypothetical protein